MLFVVKVASKDKTGTEQYRVKAVRSKWITNALHDVSADLVPGERIVQIAEGGYQC